LIEADIEMKLKNIGDSAILDTKEEDKIPFAEPKKIESLEVSKLALETYLVMIMKN